MPTLTIHPTAIVEEGAKLGENVTIEPYAIVKKTVTLHDNVTVKAHVYIDGHTTIGEGTTIWPFACIGTKTQDLKFKGETTYVKIGKHCDIREYVTVNSSCGEGNTVEIGDHCLIMAYCHVAHECKLGNHVIMSNNTQLAGHVTVGDHAVIGGCTGVHQFVRIGEHAMVGGFSRVANDIAPYTIGAGCDQYKYGGLNLVGLKRRGFDSDTRSALAKVFKTLFRSELPFEQALEQAEEDAGGIEQARYMIDFCRNSTRGVNK